MAYHKREIIFLSETFLPQEGAACPLDPLSFEDKARFQTHLPAPAYSFCARCPECWQRYFPVAFHTRLRPSEPLALRWEHLDVVHKKILVRYGLVQGVAMDLQTTARGRDADMLSTVTEAWVVFQMGRGVSLILCQFWS